MARANRYMTVEVAKISGDLGVAVRRGQTEHADELRRDLRAQQLAEKIEDTVAAFPPLTTEQRARLSALLAPTAGGA